MAANTSIFFKKRSVILNIDFCPLYALKSKRFLKYLLAIDDNRLLKQKYVASLVSPYIYMQNKVLLEEDKDKAEKMIDELQKLYIQREG